MNWALDDFKITVGFLYYNIKENEMLPDAYIQEGVKIAEKQIVTGGLRLANLLKSLNLGQKNSFLQ